MLHTVAFSGQETATTTVLTNIAGVADPTLRVSGNYIYLPALSSIARVFAIGSGLTAAQLQAPSLRSFVNLDIGMFNDSATTNNPVPIMDRGASPIKLNQNEGLQALITNGTPLGTTQLSVIVDLTDGPLVPVSGEIFTLKFTLTAVAGDYSWNNAAITLSQTLPVGTYTCVGGRLEGSGLIAWRFFPVGSAYRPGFVGVQDVNDLDPLAQRFGGRGALFTFDELTPPTIDTFGHSVSGTLTGYIDLIAGGTA